MKKHRQWTAVLHYFNEIPIDKDLIKGIRFLLDQDENVLIMIKKEDHETKPKYTQEQKYAELRKVFNEDIISNKLILSIVPDINKVIEL